MTDKTHDPADVRATDIQRRASIEWLGNAFADGCLTSEEFDRRSTTAWASVTVGDLAEVTADLPKEATEARTRKSTSDQILSVVRPASTAWMMISALCVVAWGLMCLTGGAHMVAPSWIWVLGGGATLLAPVWHVTDRHRPYH